MHLILEFRKILFEHPASQADRLRRAGYYDGEPKPKQRSHWANR